MIQLYLHIRHFKGGFHMNRNIFKILPILSLVFLLSFPNCDKSVQKPIEKSEIANELLQKLNMESLGIIFQVEPTDISVEPSENNRYLITFRNPYSIIESTFFKQLNINIPFDEDKIPVKIEEIIYKYGPKEKYLELVSFKGLTFEWSLLKSKENKNEKEKDQNKKDTPIEMTIYISLGNASFQNYNISPLLNITPRNPFELFKAMMEKNTSIKYNVENLDYGINIQEKENKTKFKIEAEKIEGIQEFLADVFMSLYFKSSKAPNLKKVLAQGYPLMNLTMIGSSFKLSIEQNDKLQGEGVAKKLDLNYFLKPNENKSYFIYGFDWDMEDLKLSIPGKKDIEKAGNIDKMKMKFALENLSAPFVDAYFNLISKSIELSANMDKEKLKQQQMKMGMSIATEFMKSQPRIRCSISPLKSYFGELEADINFKFLNLMAPPIGKAIIKVSNAKETIDKIKTTLSSETVKTLTSMANQYISIDDQGNGKIVFETKPDQPGKFFLNGKQLLKIP